MSWIKLNELIGLSERMVYRANESRVRDCSGKPTAPMDNDLVNLNVSIGARTCRVGKGISAQASHGTVREPLGSYGSYRSAAGLIIRQ